MGNSMGGGRGVRATTWWHSANNGHLPMPSDDTVTEEPIDQIVIENADSENESKSEEESRPSGSRPVSPDKAKELEEFKEELLKKREFRKKIINERKEEMQLLRRQLEEERRLREVSINENKRLLAVIAENNIELPPLNVNEQKTEQVERDCIVAKLEENIELLKERNRAMLCELAECNVEKQSLTTEVAMLNKESVELKKHIRSLKDVNAVTKEMIGIRESQLQQLKDKLAEIEKSLADREMKTLSSDLRSEYERQLANIRNLRVLYEERARVAEVTRQNLVKDLDEQKILADSHSKKCVELETKIEELEKEVSDKNDMIGTTEDQLGLSKAETRDLQADMTVINRLFSQILLGCNNSQDLDKLVVKLEENHDLLADMVVREDCTEIASALPKLILELVSQVEASETSGDDTPTENLESSIDDDAGTLKTLTSAQEIVGNLPKVWKVLIELLSHQAGPQLVISEISEKSSNSCYKSVETPSGPRMVPSVSKTYIRLKDLILEKKSLQKEMGRLKHLNGHLESRLQDQERRLGLVSSELNKTWHVVGRMQRQHQQLHTQERILQFELHQKRISLTKLKEELEFCKEKWDKAKQKNSESQEEWNKLRTEFSNRKLQTVDPVHNSPESGYSDGKASDDDSIDSSLEKKTERKRIKRKAKSTEKIAEVNQNIENGNEEEVNDSDILQDDTEELIDPIDLLSDGEGQYSGNLADTEEVNAIEDNSEIIITAGSSNSESKSETSAAEESSIPTSYDDILAARSARLKKLEEQCYVLVNKVTKTNNKGVELCNRLEELHTQYGSTNADQPTSSAENRIDSANDQPSDESNLIEPISSNNEDNAVENISNENRSESITITEDKGGTDCQIDDIQLDVINSTLNDNSDTHEINNAECASSASTAPNKFDYEARFAARDARFKIMEEQAKSLVDQVTNTSSRGVVMCIKLNELHNAYGKSEDEDANTSTSKEDDNVVEENENIENEAVSTIVANDESNQNN